MKKIRTNIIGFLISFNERPRLKIAINSLSLDNLIKAKTKPNVNINGSVIFIKFGIIKNDNIKISTMFICNVVKVVNNLDNCNNHATDIKIKKTSVQELTI